jgi:pimeloyl-ACP methyl ester carboxylesterase
MASEGIDRRAFISSTTALCAGALLNAPLVAGAQSSDVKPFTVNIPDADLVDLRRRITATRWPDRETVPDSSQGVQLATMQDLARYWATDYDWRKCEAKLNALPQFLTEIDGLDIHCIHVRSKHENALPLIVTHGWPGSIIEQLKIIEPLTNPTAHGGSASDAFHVVVPSIPGYGFSGKPTTTGWNPPKIARTWVVLMLRLGYTKFVAQGGDVGAVITDLMAEQAPPQLMGMHTNFPGTAPPNIVKALACGDPPPATLSPEEKAAYLEMQDFRTKHFAYAAEMATRPQTLYGLADSPVTLAAWLIDHGDGYGQPAPAILAAVLGRDVDGHDAGALTRDDVLDNISLYWLTNTGISAARVYWENKTPPFNAVNVSIPAAVSVFPGEIYQPPQSWTQRAYHDLIYYRRVEKGGHFAAWEQPELFSEELRAAFRPLRKS